MVFPSSGELPGNISSILTSQGVPIELVLNYKYLLIVSFLLKRILVVWSPNSGLKLVSIIETNPASLSELANILSLQLFYLCLIMVMFCT